MVRRSTFDLAHIHDCFAFHPNHMEEVKTMYKEIMGEIADSDLLQDILNQLSSSPTRITKDSNLKMDILGSEYMLS